MAAQIVADAFQERFDRALIITADSDVAPAIRIVRAAFPNKTLNVIAPPKRLGHARSLSPILEITAGRLARCLLPETMLGPDGETIYVRPRAYTPP